jgi:hypothetical protein
MQHPIKRINPYRCLAAEIPAGIRRHLVLVEKNVADESHHPITVLVHVPFTFAGNRFFFLCDKQ